MITEREPEVERTKNDGDCSSDQAESNRDDLRTRKLAGRMSGDRRLKVGKSVESKSTTRTNATAQTHGHTNSVKY